ncbi:MAG: hypothetical protein H0X24_13890 [Ktedonobacterales bacterium]|nr:hypothetical protein [Ktedonobacterales bacterium]
MLASLRRIYLYAVASAALLFLVGVLQNFFFQVSARLGARVQDYEAADAASFSRALAFLLVALAIVLPVGVLHWWFIRRDLRDDAAAAGGVVRVIFVDLLTIVLGSVTIISAGNLGYALFYSNLASRSYYYMPSVALPLSVAVAWGIGLVLVLLERQATTPLTGVAAGISRVLGYLQQIWLLISVMVLGASAIQLLMDATIRAAPDCPFDQNGYVIYSAGCQSQAFPTPGSAITQAFVLVAGLVGFTLWTRRDGGSVLRQLADSACLIIAAITVIAGLNEGLNLVLALARGHAIPLPLALVANNQTHTYRFVGPLLVGGAALALYLMRAWRTPALGAHPQQSRQVALVAVALPFAFTFLFGITQVIYLILQRSFGIVDPNISWVQVLSFVGAGSAWLALWPALARMSDPRGTGPLIPRRTYVYILLAATLVSGVSTLAVGLYFAITTAIGTPADNDGRGTAQAFAIFPVAAVTAGYYLFVLLRDGRILRNRAPATTPEAPTPTEAPTLEGLLTSVAARQLTVPQAAAILREQFGAR